MRYAKIKISQPSLLYYEAKERRTVGVLQLLLRFPIALFIANAQINFHSILIAAALTLVYTAR
jgi:hypothetical protein